MIIRNGFATMFFTWYRSVFCVRNCNLMLSHWNWYNRKCWYRAMRWPRGSSTLTQVSLSFLWYSAHVTEGMYCAVSIELDPTGYTNWSLSEEPLESAVSVGALVDLVREVKEYTSSIAGGKEVLWMNHRVRSYTVYDSTLILNYGRLSFILISL